jgi:hypothetical protein
MDWFHFLTDLFGVRVRPRICEAGGFDLSSVRISRAPQIPSDRGCLKIPWWNEALI